MRLVRYRHAGGDSRMTAGTRASIGALVSGDRVLDLGPPPAGGGLDAALLEAARRATAAAGPGEGLPPEEVVLLCPLPRPASIRDYVGFEDHARAGAARRGAELAPGWHDRPFGYRGNHRAVVGPGDDVPRPTFTRELDFELEVACIVGREIRDAGVEEAAAAILGFTVMNDWSARDLQRAEMESRMGPSKSKDFATSLGPCILVAEPGGAHPPLAMSARVNGRAVGSGRLDAARWTFPELVSYASQGETVWPGDVFGSGTPFGGCLLDHGGPWLEPGDVVEVEVEGIGVLRNTVT